MDILIPEVLNKGMSKYSSDCELSRLSSMRVGGIADFVAYPESVGELIRLVRAFTLLDIRYFIVGGGTNSLFLTDRFSGVIISTREIRKIGFDGEMFFAECGASLSHLLRFAGEQGFGGVEGMHQIPGTVGGALRSNAGAFGHQIEDILIDAELYFPEFDRVVSLKNSSMRFGYRESLIKHSDAVVLSARFKLKPRPRADIIADARAFGKKRNDTQPRGVYSVGSIFKRADSVSAGYYIDRCGLKGYKIGGASVSEKHAGFIVNRGSAVWRDVKALIGLIESTVNQRFGIVLEKEIEIVE